MDKSLISNTKQHIDNGNTTTTTNTTNTATNSNHSDEIDEIVIYSPPISATNSSNNYNYNVMSDFTNSDSTLFTPPITL
eukprot:UN01692